MTPRLLSREAAAEYCGVSVGLFEQNVGVTPIRGFGSRKLWDVKALDRWLDRLSEIDDAPRKKASVGERLNGDQGAGR
jgi:hypothetical protein